MKRFQLRIPGLSAAMASLIIMTGATGCSDNYEYEKEEPTFLGVSIYDYLKEQGNFSYYLRLIDDLNYQSVLSMTGSKTVFPANDEAWERFFKNNSYGVNGYDQLSDAQKRCLFNSSMLNMAYLSNMLSNIPASGETPTSEGMAMHRPTSQSQMDSVPFVKDATLLNAPFFTKYQDDGLYLLDGTDRNQMVIFTPEHASTNNVSNEDLSVILGKPYNTGEIYINGTKVTKSDITCKNGYIHVLEDVLTPPQDMSRVIAANGQTNIFNKLMNRFCAPYFDSEINEEIHTLYNGKDTSYPAITDSVFYKSYFTEDNPYAPDKKDMTEYGLLYYDPARNSYGGMTEVGVMFVPTDKAMNDYLESGKGRYLKDVYGSWDNVPTALVALFVKNHQKKSFMSSLPSMWPTMNDESSFAMNVKESDIVKPVIASNGVVYITDEVYPPVDYQCVYASVMTNSRTKIMNWALQNTDMKFFLYLRSMENMYNLLVPTDEALQNYRDPISWAKGKNQRQIWAFRYDETKDTPISVDIYDVNEDGTKGGFRRTETNMALIRNRLYDICDRHIVVGDKDSNGNMSGYIDEGTATFVQTKGGSTIKIEGKGDNMTVTGGGDIEQGVEPAHLVYREGSNTPDRYDSENGRTYFIDRIIQDPVNSVYKNLESHPEYSRFFSLLNGNEQVFKAFRDPQTQKDDPEIKELFTLNKTSTSSGLGFVVSSFNNFQYTVFVPTNDAIEAAFAEDENLKDWDEIVAETDMTLKRKYALHLVRFLRYHFMDNSIYIDGRSKSGNYETAARNNDGKFQKLTVASDGQTLHITDASGKQPAKVIKSEGLYNLQARDFIVDGANYATATSIVASSPSVIHLIDRALMPQ